MNKVAIAKTKDNKIILVNKKVFPIIEAPHKLIVNIILTTTIKNNLSTFILINLPITVLTIYNKMNINPNVKSGI